MDDGVRRWLAVILAADAAGYSRLMSQDENATHRALEQARVVFREVIRFHRGRVIDTAGDSVLAVFDSAIGAATAAVDIQLQLEKAMADTLEERRLAFRIGIHLGDVIESAGGAVYGDGVNIAARLQALSEPGGIVISDAVQAAVRKRLPATIEDMGERAIKGFDEPVHAFRIKADELRHVSGTFAGSEPVHDFRNGRASPVDAPAREAPRAVVLTTAQASGNLPEKMAPMFGQPPELRRSRKAVVIVDMVESVRLMETHELDVIDRWRRFVKEVETDVLPARGGRLVRSRGDGLLLEFDLVPDAAAAAVDIQHRIGAYNAARAHDAHVLLRVGVHVSDIVVDALDVYGHGVNVATRLASLAAPGEVIVSDEVRDLLVPGVDPDVEDLGECFVKHVEGALRAYRIGPAAGPGAIESLASRLHGDLMRPGIAVIPFECTMGHDPNGMLGEALAEETIFQLARSADLHVISSLSTRSLKGRQIGIGEIATHLRVAYVVSGGYRYDLSRVRVHVELAEASSERVIWAQAYDTTPQAAFDIDTSVADRIVAEVSRVILERELERAMSSPFPTLDSYTLLLGAITLMHRASLTQFDRARAMLEYLAQRQGRRGVAHAWLAKWHVLRVVQGWSQDAAAEGREALTRAERALESNPLDGLALSIAGLVHAYLLKDLVQAGRLYSDARAANPNEPLAWLFSATWHAYRGEGPEASSAAEMALRLSPLDPMRYFFDSLAATATLGTGDWKRSIELCERSIRANRLHASTWRTVAFALVMSGRLDEARRAVEELRAIEPAFTVARFLERFPGRDGPLAQPWAQALREAGLPS